MFKTDALPPTKLCLGEVRPHHPVGEIRRRFCLIVAFNTSLTVTDMKEWDLLTLELKGMGEIMMLISAERGAG